MTSLMTYIQRVNTIAAKTQIVQRETFSSSKTLTFLPPFLSMFTENHTVNFVLGVVLVATALL